ncbi:MAG: sulfatase-like hydrolase/transferase [Erythrobacter sp.]|nr:sulfatase-like hydrolase/transferase [Erythrobacter sp.]
MNMIRKSASRILRLAISAAALTLLPSLTQAQDRPNIVFIMADDMGYADLSVTGAQGYTTPVLDQLAADGVRLEQAYANSAICSPTRTALVTGRYQYRFRAGLAEPNIRFPDGSELPAGTPTVASLLGQLGYRTALVGKWHVSRVPDHGPTTYGYDYFFGITGGAADYFRHGFVNNGEWGEGLFEGQTPTERHGYLTDLLTDQAIAQLGSGDGRPLFISLHYTAPHWPWEGPEDGERPATLTRLNDPYGGSLETYAAMMRSLDTNVGRLLAALDERGMADNTLVVFTSDNGAERFSNTWPFVGYKGELLEGGIRVPVIVRWPGHLQAGRLSQQVMVTMDFLPTFIEAAGGQVPDGLDGVSVLPQLEGAPDRPRTLFWRFNAASQAALRDGDWKYLRIGANEGIYDLSHDPRERNNLGDLYPERLAAMRTQWDEWNAAMLPYPAGSASEGNFGRYVDRYWPPVQQDGGSQ